MRNLMTIGLAASLFVALGGTVPRPAAAISAPSAAPIFDGSLAVLTYNIKGLPWPITQGRPAAFARIAARLRQMRNRGNAPQVVVLQEAFTGDAQAIGAAAGYRYAALGPGASDAAAAAVPEPDRAFASRAHWWSGETEGKWVGSGLEVLSDYPITAVRRMAFPSFACAGFDCLANKGALLVTIAVPGAATPIDVVTTHLNSRRASRVDDSRSAYAYRLQVDALTAFVRRSHDPRFPLVVAGDFNVGSAPARRAALLGAVHARWTPGTDLRDALGQFRRQGGLLAPDAAYARRRARDWQFYGDGAGAAIALDAIDVPFGREPSGGMLSDHVGYIARFRLDRAATSATRSKR